MFLADKDLPVTDQKPKRNRFQSLARAILRGCQIAPVQCYGAMHEPLIWNDLHE